MGADGFGNFDNDDAMDWLANLKATRDATLLSETLGLVTRLKPEDYLEAPDACNALAAAEVVAALAGKPSADLPTQAAEWTKRNWALYSPALATQAAAAVARVKSNSELKDLWDEAGSSEWLEVVTDLERRLGAKA